MRVGLRHFSSESIEWLKKESRNPTQTRCSLAKTLCELEQWKNSRGKFCLASARKALPKIADKAGFSLPPSKPMVTGISCGAGSVEITADFPDNKVSCPIEELRGISLEIVEDKDKSLWRSMMASHHPRGWSRTPGKQIEYWIKSESRGVLGGIGFCAASWNQKARDDSIGWSQRARVLNLEYVVNNHRFLLLPGVDVKNLASFALGAAAKRLRHDWKEKFGVSPLFAYSYISSGIKGLLKARELEGACEGTRVITVCDREGDMWELLREGVHRGDGLLVRSKKGHNRRVAVGEKTENLWKHINSRPVLARRKIEVDACGGKRKRKSREVTLEIRASRVRLVAKEGADAKPLDMLAVSAFEPDPPSGKEGLHWVLLTTEGDETAEDAVRTVKWYEARWSIEEYFKALKTGTGIKERRFDCADDLRKCLAFDVVTAYRVFDLERMAREKPDIPARDVVGSELEDQKIRSLNERIFKQSTKIAGRSKKLLCSLSNKR